MKRFEIDELNALAQKILLLCAQAEIDNGKEETEARKNRERIALVKNKEGVKNGKED